MFQRFNHGVHIHVFSLICFINFHFHINSYSTIVGCIPFCSYVPFDSMSKLALFFKPNTYELQKNCCILFKLIEAKLYHIIKQLCTLNKYIFLKIIQFYEITMVFYNLEIWSFNPDQIKFFFFFFQVKPIIQGMQVTVKDLKKNFDIVTLSIPVYGFPGSSVGKESACSAGDPGLTPGLRRSPEEANSNTLHILA